MDQALSRRLLKPDSRDHFHGSSRGSFGGKTGSATGCSAVSDHCAIARCLLDLIWGKYSRMPRGRTSEKSGPTALIIAIQKIRKQIR